MLTSQEEAALREKVRQSLNLILKEPREEVARDVADGGAERGRLSEAEKIIAEETERYYQGMGLVKHISRSGQVFWITPAEERRLRKRRAGFRAGFLGKLAKLSPRTLLVWSATLLVAVLLVAYLVNNETIAGMLPRQ